MNLKGFKKLNEAVSPEFLGEDELTKLEDCVLDEEIGKPKKRGGWAKYNTNTADVGSTIKSLHEVVAEGGNNYLLEGITSATAEDNKLVKSLSGTGTWSDVTEKGTPPYKMQAYADKFVFTDGLVAPFIVSGTTLQTVTDLEIIKPDVSLVVTGLYNGGSLTIQSYYKWVIVYVTNDGTVSPPSQPINLLCTYQMAGFNNMPVSSDARVTHRYIYRTKANEETYYFHSEIDNTSTQWIDSKADTDLGSETFNFLNMPATMKYLAIHKERLVGANLTRLVKCWVTPAHSKGGSGSYNLTFENATYAFTGNLGLKNSIATTGGTLTAGTYTYRFIYLDEEGIVSDVLDSNDIVVNGTSNTATKIYDFPEVAHDYDGVTRAKMYRKKDSGSFQLLYEYDPRRPVTTYTAPFEIIDTGFTATTAYASNQTTDAEKCSIAFSEIANLSSFLLEDVRDIFPDDGDEITGIYDDQDGILIFKVRSICKIFTNGSPDNWRLVKVVTDIGCDEANSLLKYGNDYAFSHNGEIYTYNSSKGYKNIGVDIWDTLSTVTVYHCATADDGWFLFGVTASGLTKGYGFLAYDYIVGSWYLFNTTSIPYVAHVKQIGTDAGTILTSNADYILKYGDGTVDTDTGSNVDIVPIIRTKTFGDGIILNRLRNLRFNYKKQDDKTCTITIVNPDTGTTNTHADTTNSTNSSDFKLYEDVTGKATDSLKETEKFYIQITGAGFTEFGNLQLTLKQIKRGRTAQ